MMRRISCQRAWFRRPLSFGLFLLAGILAVLGSGRPVAAQPAMRGAAGIGGRTVPTKSYPRRLRRLLRRRLPFGPGAISDRGPLWNQDRPVAAPDRLDPCCETMEGECYYQMGMYAEALVHYTAALEIYQAFPAWLSQVALQPIRADLTAPKPPPWQVRRLQAATGPIAPNYALGTRADRRLGHDSTGWCRPAGQLVSHRAARDRALHGVGDSTPRRAARAARGLRQHVLDGSVIAALLARPGQLNHWSESWINLELQHAGPLRRRAVSARRPASRSCKRPRWPRARSSIR